MLRKPCYLHLAPNPTLAKALLEKKVTGIAYETVELSSGALPLLAPMSEVAGRMSIQVGADLLLKPNGGLGVLLINKDPLQSNRVTVSVDGYNYSTKGTRYDWGQASMDANKSIEQAPVENLGANFTIEVPRQGITALVIPAP